jgi:hypothetical protein
VAVLGALVVLILAIVTVTQGSGLGEGSFFLSAAFSTSR